MKGKPSLVVGGNDMTAALRVLLQLWELSPTAPLGDGFRMLSCSPGEAAEIMNRGFLGGSAKDSVVLLRPQAPELRAAAEALRAANFDPAECAYLGSKGNTHRYVDGAGTNLLVTIDDNGTAVVETVAKERTL